jgi:NAD-dependent deacetylase
MNIVILTGAGISAESGVPTFRAADGLWCGHPVEDVATPEAYERNPALVQSFYNERRRQLRQVAPNAAHHALARLERDWESDVLLVTQNVDDLHDRARAAHPELARRDAFAGRPSLIHMHGELLKARCLVCERVCHWDADLEVDSPCMCQNGSLRPHIVWFGEMPLLMHVIERAVMQCDLFVSIGTSGMVYPAAGFVQMARAVGADTVEINLEPTAQRGWFDRGYYGPASEQVPLFVEEILAKGP